MPSKVKQTFGENKGWDEKERSNVELFGEESSDWGLGGEKG